MQYLLPDLGEGMAEAEIVQWQVAVGDHVTRDQIVVHVQTDKAEVELPVPASGTVTALGASVGDIVPVGAPLLDLVPDDGATLAGTPVRTSATTGPNVGDTGPNVGNTGNRGPVVGRPPLGAADRTRPGRAAGPQACPRAGCRSRRHHRHRPGGRVTAADVRATRRHR